MSNFPPSKYSTENVLRDVHDKANQRLRVDAEVTANIAVAEVQIDSASGDNIAISDGTNTLAVNSDGTINVNISDITISHTDDSIKIGDGTNLAAVTEDNALKVDASSTIQPVSQSTSPWVVSGSVFTTPAAGTLDAFARQRISEPYTLGDYKHLYGIDPNFIDYTLNGGTITFQPNKACARLATSSNINSKSLHQTKCYHHYMPGKSQLIMSSFNFYTNTTNVTKRTGLFDDNNGIYFEQTGNGTLNIVLRSYVDGIVSENRVPQSLWNIDKCDGTGASAFEIDITKTQLLFIDFQWLGVGRVRVGFAHQGSFVEAHYFNGENNLTTVYMSNPNLPVRCEILNTGATSGAYMDQICSTVVSEGGYVEAGIDWALASPTARALSVGQTLPILAIRLKNTYKTYLNRMLVRLNQSMVFTDSGNIQFSIIKLQNASSLTGGAGTWTSVDSDSGIEYLADATGYSNTDIMSVGFAAAASNGANKAGSDSHTSTPGSAKKNYIVQNFDSTNSEVYAVIAKNIDSKATNVSVGLQWREIY